MKGFILGFSAPDHSGVISGDDGVRYAFDYGDWKHNGFPANGDYVDFEAEEGNIAKDVFLVPAAQRRAAVGVVPVGDKSKVAAGLLAIVVGSLGIHKFYLGYSKQGLIMLLVSVLLFFLVFPIVIMAVIALIEGILYLTMSDEQFDRTYVQGRKPWF